MSKELTFKIETDGDLFIAQCLDVEIDSDGLTREDAILNLQEALALHYDHDDLVLIEAKQP